MGRATYVKGHSDQEEDEEDGGDDRQGQPQLGLHHGLAVEIVRGEEMRRSQEGQVNSNPCQSMVGHHETLETEERSRRIPRG